MTLIFPPVNEVVAQYLKMMVNNRNDWPSQFLRSEDVCCKTPWSLFNTVKEGVPHKGRYFFVKRTANSGKTDKCVNGCWRIMGRDKLIKSEKTGKKLGFKKVYKFCIDWSTISKSTERWIRFWNSKNQSHRKTWVMEEYRLASPGKQDYVICKIRILKTDALDFLLSMHVRGYYTYDDGL